MYTLRPYQADSVESVIPAHPEKHQTPAVLVRQQGLEKVWSQLAS